VRDHRKRQALSPAAGEILINYWEGLTEILLHFHHLTWPSPPLPAAEAVRTVYRRHCPAKSEAEVAAVLQRFEGREATLLAKVRAKYEQQHGEAAAGVGAGAVGSGRGSDAPSPSAVASPCSAPRAHAPYLPPERTVSKQQTQTQKHVVTAVRSPSAPLTERQQNE
jgi:hypothetical protein